MPFPQDLLYTKDHEWVRVAGDPPTTGTVGITQFAVDQLGDVTMVELPKVGETVTRGKVFGTVESVKAVSDLYAPLSGKVTKVNSALADAPEEVNASPYDKAWMIEIELSNPDEAKELMGAATYTTHVAEPG
jgi:glycine cleavage system H protein